MRPELPCHTTLDEMWEAAETLSNDDTIGFVEAWTGVWNVGQYIWSNGGDVLAPDYSTAEGYINGPEAVAVIQKLADLYKKKALTGPTLDPGALGDTERMGCRSVCDGDRRSLAGYFP